MVYDFAVYLPFPFQTPLLQQNTTDKAPLYGPLGTRLDVSQHEMKVNGRGSLKGICVAGANVGIAIE